MDMRCAIFIAHFSFSDNFLGILWYFTAKIVFDLDQHYIAA